MIPIFSISICDQNHPPRLLAQPGGAQGGRLGHFLQSLGGLRGDDDPHPSFTDHQDGTFTVKPDGKMDGKMMETPWENDGE